MKALLFAFAIAATACSGDGGMQMCGADHCGLQGHTVVKWTFDAYPNWMFPMDSCVDFGVLKVRVDAQAADGSVVTQIEDCGAAQSTFDGLAENQPYTVFVEPEDIALAPLVTYPATATVNAGAYQADTSVTANVPWTSWIGTFTGTFLFRLSWATQGCAAAGVVTQNVTLSVNGTVVPAVADNGQRLDGTDPKPCYDIMQQFPQSATGVPFGPATLKVDGYDGSATPVLIYSQTFNTFVGAGITNPTITFDVPAAS
ncbi:MAG TPA: hypothetical protein VFQ65_10345 [Kofleriaceae bacterium]|nr:hypothetical protein [Kofleriaceae bacterium]